MDTVMEPYTSIQSLTKLFNLEDGIYVIYGHCNSGKTSLLNIFLKSLPPTTNLEKLNNRTGQYIYDSIQIIWEQKIIIHKNPGDCNVIINLLEDFQNDPDMITKYLSHMENVIYLPYSFVKNPTDEYERKALPDIIDTDKKLSLGEVINLYFDE